MPTPNDDGVLELDILFKQVERSAFKGKSNSAIGGTMSAETSNEIGMAETMELIQSMGSDGLVNGDFETGPIDDPTGPIDDEDNSLEGWDYIVEQGDWEVMWVEDVDGPQGYALEFTQTTAAEHDEVMLEQDIAIERYRRLVTTVRHSGDVWMELRVRVAFLDGDGEELFGGDSSTFLTDETLTTRRLWMEPPALAVGARIQVGVYNPSGVTGTRKLLFVSVSDPETTEATVTGMFSHLQPEASTVYDLSSPTDIVANGVYIAQRDGFVSTLSATTTAPITAGGCYVYLYNQTENDGMGGNVSFNDSRSEDHSRFTLTNMMEKHFSKGDVLFFRLECDGGFTATDPGDWSASATLVYVVRDAGDWT